MIRWVVVLPVKGTAAAKSRLFDAKGDAPGLPPAGRGGLALALALDTVCAVLSAEVVERVVVVTTDDVAGRFDEVGATVVRDPGRGLNAAFSHGIHVAGDLEPGLAVAAMTADLAAIRPADVTDALGLASRHPLAVIVDKDGVGTTTITATRARDLEPRFGIDSARRHLDAGHVGLAIAADSRMRLDIDTADDLAVARALGLGPRTSALFRR